MNYPVLDAARLYATLGIPLFLLKHGSKDPATMHGYKDAGRPGPAFLANLERSCVAGKPYNLGISRLRWSLPDGGCYTVCIDIDVRNSGDVTFAALEHLFPMTWYARTGRGGNNLHLYYRTSRPSVDFIGSYQGMDVKHLERGYLVAPPSLHPETLMPYEWLRFTPAEPPPLLPKEVEELVLKPVAQKKAATGRAERVITDLPKPPKQPTLMERLFHAAQLVITDRDATGRVHVVCPNADEHTTASPASSTSVLPSRDGMGVFRCLHSHCHELSRVELAWLLLSRHPVALAAVRPSDPIWLRRLALSVNR